jgi:hypothetical protein
MLGFVSLASAPIADDASSYITLPSVTTGAPVVPNLTAQINHPLAPDNVTTSAPTVASLNAQISYSFVTNNVITGAPVLTGRWQWVVQPDDTQNWTDVPEVTDVWSNAA